MSNTNNILNEINDDDLLAYVNKNMSQEERYDFEKKMNDNAFLSDAAEGLNYLSNDNKLNEYVTQLNNHLHVLTQAPKKKRAKRQLIVQDWILLAVVLTIALCTVAYFILHKKGIV